MANNQTESGSELKVYWNSNLIGVVTSFGFDVDYGRRAIPGIDILSPSEITTGMVKVKCSMGIVALKGDGGASGWGLVVQSGNNSLEKYNSIAVLNRATDEVVFSSNYVLLSGQSWTMKSRTTVTGSLSFLAIDFLDGSGPGTLLSDAVNLLNRTAS